MKRRRPSRGTLVAVLVSAVLVAAVAFLFSKDGGNAFSLTEQDPKGLSYLWIFLLVAADAVIPVFPGETTLNAASVASAQGNLSLSLVILSGALAAIVGDSTLFWIARRGSGRIRPQLERARSNKRVSTSLDYLGDNAKILLVFGRYVPGLRFVVNTTMGLSDIPYRTFLPWSALGGAGWSAYTCLLAYWVGSTIEDYPVASMVLSGAITTTLIAVLFLRERRARARAERGVR